MSGGLRLLRLGGLVRKESLQVLRDPSSLSIAFVMPLILLFIFGYGFTLDAERVAVGLVVEAPGNEAQSFVSAFTNSRFFAVRRFGHRTPALAALEAGRVRGVVVLREDFAAALRGQSRDPPVQVLLDGVEANTARILTGYIGGLWENWSRQEAMAAGRAPARRLAAEPRVWFNAELRSRNFLVPGLIAIIMTLTGTLLTALVVAREWERGTMEALLSTPLGIGELLLGKLIPYFLLGMGGLLVSLALARFVFAVPLRGSFVLLLGVSAVFLIGALAMGLLISTLARNQFVAGQIAIVTSFLPAFMLSGFVFEIGSAPPAIQWISQLVLARYFVAILQTLFLAGDIWAVIGPNLAAMAGLGAAFLGLTLWRTRRRLA